jgi:aromatic ring-opening dioxygenase LigB subunit
MKKVLVILVSLLFIVNLGATEVEKKKINKFKINELIILPHIGKIIKFNSKELKITKEQMKRISKEVKQVYPPKFQALIREAFPIEKKVQRKVLKGATYSEVKEELDKIAKLKREAINIKIEALNTFSSILTKQQWGKIIKLSK